MPETTNPPHSRGALLGVLAVGLLGVMGLLGAGMFIGGGWLWLRPAPVVFSGTGSGSGMSESYSPHADEPAPARPAMREDPPDAEPQPPLVPKVALTKERYQMLDKGDDVEKILEMFGKPAFRQPTRGAGIDEHIGWKDEQKQWVEDRTFKGKLVMKHNGQKWNNHFAADGPEPAPKPQDFLRPPVLARAAFIASGVSRQSAEDLMGPPFTVTGDPDGPDGGTLEWPGVNRENVKLSFKNGFVVDRDQVATRPPGESPRWYNSGLSDQETISFGKLLLRSYSAPLIRDGASMLTRVKVADPVEALTICRAVEVAFPDCNYYQSVNGLVGAYKMLVVNDPDRVEFLYGLLELPETGTKPNDTSDANTPKRRMAIEVLGSFKDPAHAAPIARQLRSRFCVEAASKELSDMGPGLAETAVLGEMNQPQARFYARSLLAKWGTSPEVIAVQVAHDAVSDDPKVRELALNCHKPEQFSTPVVVDREQAARVLEQFTHSSKPETVVRALTGLGQWSTKGAVPRLVEFVKTSGGENRRLAITALGASGDSRGAEAVALVLGQKDLPEEDRAVALAALTKLGFVASDAVTPLVGSPDNPRARLDAARLLKDIGTRDALPLLEKAAADPKADPELRAAAKEAVQVIARRPR